MQAHLNEWSVALNIKFDYVASDYLCGIPSFFGRGMNYLHEHKPEAIIHCDLEPP